MSEHWNNLVPCPECGREKSFEGLCYYCRQKKEREQYQSMDESAISKMIDEIVLEIKTSGKLDKKDVDFMSLLAYHNINTGKIAESAFEKKIFYPYELYRDASDDVKECLIELLLKPKCNDANNIMCCLAINGSERVKEVFMQLEKNPLPWRKKLYVDPSVYAECGGWTFDEKGNRNHLIYPKCYSLTKEDRKDDAIIVGNKREDKCPVCSCNLIDILSIDGRDERLSFLEIKGTIKLPICPSCASMCEKTIIRYNIDGESSMEIIDAFEEDNMVSDEEMKNIENNRLKLSLNEVPIYYSRGVEDICTIGGQPDWIQDFVYETCPDCGKKMKFLSALVWEQFYGDYMEGTLFIEHCPDCNVAVAFHQQT